MSQLGIGHFLLESAVAFTETQCILISFEVHIHSIVISEFVDHRGTNLLCCWKQTTCKYC